MMLDMTPLGTTPDGVPDALLDQLIDELIDAGRTVVERGLVVASGGNLSARVPGSDAFVVTATGTWLDRLTPADLVVMGMDGERRAGADRPSVEWKLHHRTYAVRADVGAIVHLHPQHVLLVDVLGQPIRLVTSDHQVYLGSVGRIPFLPAGSQEVADAAAEQAREHNAVVLAHHGCSALGDGVEMALRRAMNLEEAATMTYRLLLAGDTTAQFPPEWVGRVVTA
jgi:L-fuculose-phosphate aldolase